MYAPAARGVFCSILRAAGAARRYGITNAYFALGAQSAWGERKENESLHDMCVVCDWAQGIQDGRMAACCLTYGKLPNPGSNT